MTWGRTRVVFKNHTKEYDISFLTSASANCHHVCSYLTSRICLPPSVFYSLESHIMFLISICHDFCRAKIQAKPISYTRFTRIIKFVLSCSTYCQKIANRQSINLQSSIKGFLGWPSWGFSNNGSWIKFRMTLGRTRVVFKNHKEESGISFLTFASANCYHIFSHLISRIWHLVSIFFHLSSSICFLFS